MLTESTPSPKPATEPLRRQPLPAEFPGSYAVDVEEEEALLRVCRSRSFFRYYGENPQHETARFEQEFAEYLGIGHVVAVTSGTAALHTALAALRIGPGQEVIVPAFLWISVVAAVVNLGAIPVLAEVDDSFGLQVEDVRRKITSRTAALLVVHMCGAPSDIVPLVAMAREHGLAVIEDCAQSLGATVHGRHVGTFGDIGIFSFQVNKNMSSGEGGAVVTNDGLLYRRAVAIHDIGFARDALGELHLTDATAWGWTRGYRLDEFRAAILRVQLRKLPETLRRLRRSYRRLEDAIAAMPGVRVRRMIDGASTTGGFLITLSPTPEAARHLNARLRWHRIYCSRERSSNTVLADYGLHIYSNIPALAARTPTDGAGSPWALEANREASYDYRLGACPHSDGLFSRGQVMIVPALLKAEDEQDIVNAFADALLTSTS